MDFMEEKNFNKLKNEQTLKKKLKKLFENDLDLLNEKTTRHYSTKTYDISSTSSPASMELIFSENVECEEDFINSNSIGYKNKNIENNKKKTKNQFNENKSTTTKIKTVNASNNKNYIPEKTLKKVINFKNKNETKSTQQVKCTYGPIASGYIPATSTFLSNNKRKLENDIDVPEKKIQNQTVCKKKTKINSTNGSYENPSFLKSLKKSEISPIQNNIPNKKPKNSATGKSKFIEIKLETANKKKLKSHHKSEISKEKSNELKDNAFKNGNKISQKNITNTSEFSKNKPKNMNNLKNNKQEKKLNDIKLETPTVKKPKEKKNHKRKIIETSNENLNNKSDNRIEKNDINSQNSNKERKVKTKKKDDKKEKVKESNKNENLSLVKKSFFDNIASYSTDSNDDSYICEEEIEEESYFDSEFDDCSYLEEDSHSDDLNEYEENSYSDDLSEYEEDSYSDDLSEYEEEESVVNEYVDYDFESVSDDEDYKLPEDVAEDLYIPCGIATKYDIDENIHVSFDSDCGEPQIIELPSESIESKNDVEINKLDRKEKLSKFNEKLEVEKNEDSDTSCPQLIPIDNKLYNQRENIAKVMEDEMIEETVSEFSSEQFSDSCSEYSEITEGSLCLMENQEDEIEEASKMKPEIFNIQENQNIEKENLSNCELFSFENGVAETEISIAENILENFQLDSTCESNSNVLTILPEKDILSKKQPIVVDQLKSKFYNGIDSRNVLVVIKDKIHIYGTIKLKLIAGSIDIFGYIPNTNETIEIYSPRGYCFLNITPIKNNTNINLKEILCKYNDLFSCCELNEIVENFDLKNDAILLMQRNESAKKIEFLGKYMKENLFPSMNSIQMDRPYYGSEFILRSVIYKKTDNELLINPEWKNINIKSTTRMMIIGGKSVGKSTCLRYLINKEIKKHKFLLIDLDIGQPEIFLPQTMSATVLNRPLLGPGYFLNLNPNKSIVYGGINIVLAPEKYLESIKELAKYCHEIEEFKNIPWIINTMGYNKGFGCELIAILCHYFRPTEVLQLQSSINEKNFYYLMEKEALAQIPLNIFKNENLLLETPTENFEYLEKINFDLIVLESILNNNSRYDNGKKKEWEMHSKDSRYAMLITRLGSILQNKYDWLTDIKPICCSLDDIKFKLYTDDIISEEEYLDIINANIVYLCHYKNDEIPLECYGIGIVRGIDRTSRKIYLISSVPIQNMKYVNCLSICNIPLPSAILLNQGPKIRSTVPYIYNTNDFIATRGIKHFDRLKKKN